MACAPRKDSDQPGHPPSLITVFAVHIKGGKEPKLRPCRQRKLWQKWTNAQGGLSLRRTQMPFCWFSCCLPVSFLHGIMGTGNQFNARQRNSKKCRETRDYYLSNGALWLNDNADGTESDV